MTKRTTLSLGSDAMTTLRLLADALGFNGNVSEFLRWLAGAADGAFSETVTLLKVAAGIAAGADDWDVLAAMAHLLPPLRLEIDWQRVDDAQTIEFAPGGVSAPPAHGEG